MNWWNNLVEKPMQLGTSLVSAAKWAWNKSYPSRIALTTLKFSSNIAFHSLGQIGALPSAARALKDDAGVLRFANSFKKIIMDDVLRMLLVHYVNNSLQHYLAGEEKEQTENASIFLNTLLQSINAMATLYIWRQGSQAFVRLTALNMVAPSVFNAHKNPPPPSYCRDEQCNALRQLKGMGRAPLIFYAKKGAIWAVGQTPYVGGLLEAALRIRETGNYIDVAVTPERCERHKQSESEFDISLGLSFFLLREFATQQAKRFFGELPLPLLIVLDGFLENSLMHIASHMNVPSTTPKESTLPVDPFQLLDVGLRFYFDVIFSGLAKQVPIYFKPMPGVEPLIAWPDILQFLTKHFNATLEQEGQIVVKEVRPVKDFLVPKLFHSDKDFTQDHVINEWWNDLRKNTLSALNIMDKIIKSQHIDTITHPYIRHFHALEQFLYFRWGIPTEVTKTVLELRSKREVIDFITAMKMWLERLGGQIEMKLENPDTPIPLLGERAPSLPLPASVLNTPVIPLNQLLEVPSPLPLKKSSSLRKSASKSKVPEIPIDLLMSSPPPSEAGDDAHEALDLFSTETPHRSPLLKHSVFANEGTVQRKSNIQLPLRAVV